MSEMTWFEEQVMTHGRVLIMGHLESTGWRNDQIGAVLTAIQLVKLAKDHCVFVVLSYARHPKEAPSLTASAQVCASEDEALKSWRKQFYPDSRTGERHDTVRVTLQLGGPYLKLSDPWLLYHLGALTEITRASKEPALTNWEPRVLEAVVDALEALTTARIKRVADEVVGRR